ncbi:hypothetical protein KIW84_058256 [Lathyrus oleraceus]|uniref:Uncharacterized protein n=1 Tax=Pisum sativum TaxID=3888 RepID=A0A9D4X3H3_PEA|nr:hypothetical protein KIW84_058256 [Pisum sativum]
MYACWFFSSIVHVMVRLMYICVEQVAQLCCWGLARDMVLSALVVGQFLDFEILVEKFLGSKHEEQYRELASQNIWSERTFNINPQVDYKDCLEIIEKKKWKKLCTPLTNLNYEIVREFYANDIPVEDQPYSFMTMVIRTRISFSRDAINAYLGNPLTLEDGMLCEYGKRLAKGGWNIELVKDALVLPRKSYEVNVAGAPKNFLRKNLTMIAQVDVGRIISNEIKMITESARRLGSKTPSTLTFPGMIRGCAKEILQLHTREPHFDHMLPTREEFQQHANWPEGRRFYPEGAVNEEEEEGEASDES